MFSSVGWGEVLVLIIVGIIVVGPERLPRIINDVKAIVLAARNAVSTAREQIDSEFKENFEDLRKPLSQLNDVRRMGARGLVSKALLDDDPEFLREMQDTARGVTGAFSATRGRTGHPQAEESADRGTESAGEHTGTATGTAAAAATSGASAGTEVSRTPGDPARTDAAPDTSAATAPSGERAVGDWSRVDDADIL